PFTGWGLRNFTPLYLDHTHTYLGHPHNIFLMFTAEIGIPATLLLCGLVGWILARAVILLRQDLPPVPRTDLGDRLILLAYVLAFGNCILFNCFDVTALDVRVNAMGWLLLSAIAGVVTQTPWARIKEH
ncbi:MAG: polymerase, partial [Cyanobacteria bacterium]|nr:polymerase [Cyanobacteriota bacterium]MDW8202828.1 polymerase [Cyanobacteriota bacterium SKYGB_h_bin112]